MKYRTKLETMFKQRGFYSLNLALAVLAVITMVSINSPAFAAIASNDLAGNERPATKITVGALEPSTGTAAPAPPPIAIPAEVPQAPTGIFLTIEPN